jgi:hypothetical protein
MQIVCLDLLSLYGDSIVEKVCISLLLKRELLYVQWRLGILFFIGALQHTQLSIVLYHTSSLISSGFEELSFTNLQSLSIPCSIPHYPLISAWHTTWKIPVSE